MSLPGIESESPDYMFGVLTQSAIESSTNMMKLALEID